MKNENELIFLDKLEKTYFEMAFTELAMDYYCLKEKDLENDHAAGNKVAAGFRKRLEELIERCFKEFDELEEAGRKAESLREELIERVELLTAAIDRLELDNYVKIRSGFEDEPFDYPDNDEASKVILRFIFGYEDNNIVNDRLRQAVYELPVRMTRDRFFDIIKNGMKLYIGSGKDVLDRCIYLLESSSGLSGDRIPAEVFADRDKEDIVTEYDYLENLTGICNYICVIGKCSKEVRDSERGNIEKLLELIKVSSELNEDNYENAEKILSGLEGKLEDLSERIVRYEAKLSGYIDSTDELEPKAERLEKMRRLMSDSIYADLEPEADDEISENDVEKEFEKFYNELSERFKDGDRALNRARMAACLSVIPVFFNSKTEVMNYVRGSLDSCRNIHEKNVAISNIVSLYDDGPQD
ncbi:MAG: hypothetical protein IKP88_08025 [Lachnospiraceae bacterium]|nr:hypothetical protein [Lachnospiraceae bacterium]